MFRPLAIFLATVGLANAQLRDHDTKDAKRGLFFSSGDDEGDGSAGIGLGTAWASAAEGIARQPEARNQITTAAILGSLFITAPNEVSDTLFSNNPSERTELANAIKSFVDELFLPPN